MSRFRDPDDQPRQEKIVGSVITGAFECDVCFKVVASAIYNRREERLYWDCPDGHNNSIAFKI
jgi:hypothetical protein